MLEEAKIVMHKIEPGLAQYIEIMDYFRKVDVSVDKGFQRKFNRFYKVRFPGGAIAYEMFYKFMEDEKANGTTFERTLSVLTDKLGRLEASFSSKLVATIHPEKPIIDAFVLKNLGLKKPWQYSKTRLEDTLMLYREIEDWYADYLESDEAYEIINLFDQMYPVISITAIKKIDFVLWQIRG